MSNNKVIFLESCNKICRFLTCLCRINYILNKKKSICTVKVIVYRKET